LREVSDGLFVVEQVFSWAFDIILSASAALEAGGHFVHDTFVVRNRPDSYHSTTYLQVDGLLYESMSEAKEVSYVRSSRRLADR
jgi:hypothetical protein